MPRQYTSLLDQLESEAYRNGLRAGSKKAMKWFRKRIKQIEHVDQGDLLKDKNRRTTMLTPGKMYMYRYSPKHKDTLPYYDIYPLIFPIAKYDDGHLGINVHYLPPKHRAVLLQRLMDFATNKQWDETTKIMMSWDLLKKSSKFNLVVPCIKRYLKNHVRTKYLQIESYDWAPAIFLPTASFKKATRKEVWKDSMKMAKKR